MWPKTDSQKTQPWLEPPPAADNGRDFMVVGAGVAGAAIARVLAERGCDVRVMDSAGIASGASGNPAAVLRPVLARDADDPLSRFYSTAFTATAERIKLLRLQGHAIAGEFAGAVHCHRHAQDMRGDAKHQYLNAEQVSARLGSAAQDQGVLLEDAGWVSPVDYCTALLAHDNIKLIQGELTTLEHDGLAWRLFASEGSQIASADNVILANGWQMSHLAATETLPINPVLSQLLHFGSEHSNAGPALPLVGGGTICPSKDGWMATAGHWHNSTDSTADPERNAEILSRCNALWTMPINAETAQIRAAVRATSPDYLPLVGGVPDVKNAQLVYDDLQHGRPAHHYPNAPHLPNLYMVAALGGRGITSAYFCAQVLEAVIFAQQHPWQRALHPLRFLIRQLKRGKT